MLSLPPDPYLCCGRTTCCYRGHFTLNQIGRQRWKSIVSVLGPAVFDSHIAAFDITCFAQGLQKTGYRRRI